MVQGNANINGVSHSSPPELPENLEVLLELNNSIHALLAKQS